MTAVDFLQDKLSQVLDYDLMELFEQAKEMEEQQLNKAWQDGVVTAQSDAAKEIDKMKSPIQLMIEQLESVKRDEPKTMIHNLKQFANDLLVDEKHMVADAWRAGNKDGWDMSTDWHEDGDRYYENKYTGKNGA